MAIGIENNENSFITVNSSRYAVPIYEKLGFVKMKEEKEQDGLNLLPMKLILKDEAGRNNYYEKIFILFFVILSSYIFGKNMKNLGDKLIFLWRN